MALHDDDTNIFEEIKSSENVNYFTIINCEISYQIPEDYTKISRYIHKHFNQSIVQAEQKESDKLSPASTIKLDNLNIEQSTWECILTYLNHHKGEFIKRIPSPLLDDTQITDIVSDMWDVNYIENIDIKDMLVLISAAECLDIRSLVNLIVVKISIMLKNDPTSDIKNLVTQHMLSLHPAFSPLTSSG